MISIKRVKREEDQEQQEHDDDAEHADMIVATVRQGGVRNCTVRRGVGLQCSDVGCGAMACKAIHDSVRYGKLA